MADRARQRKPWIKLYPQDCLDGSIRYQLEAAERGVWYDILNFAALCAHPGLISDKDKRPYPHTFIANRLNITLELFETTLKKCLDEGRLNENSHGIIVVNWHAYQSEYQRQKPYREAKKATSVDPGKFGSSASTSKDVKMRRAIKGKREDPK